MQSVPVLSFLNHETIDCSFFSHFKICVKLKCFLIYIFLSFLQRNFGFQRKTQHCNGSPIFLEELEKNLFPLLLLLLLVFNLLLLLLQDRHQPATRQYKRESKNKYDYSGGELVFGRRFGNEENVNHSYNKSYKSQPYQEKCCQCFQTHHFPHRIHAVLSRQALPARPPSSRALWTIGLAVFPAWIASS